MKTHALLRGLRVTLTKTELQALLGLARYGADQLANGGYFYLPKRQETAAPDVIRGLELGLVSLQWKQAEAQEKRDRPKREAARRASREHHADVDGYSVIGTLGDWTDISDDPDFPRWADLHDPGTEPREQVEIRRSVWRILLTRGSTVSGDLEVLLGDCTQTADRDEIEELARRIIARHGK